MKYRTRISSGLFALVMVLFFIAGCGVQTTEETDVPGKLTASPAVQGTVPSVYVSPASSLTTVSPSTTVQNENHTVTPDAEVSDLSEEDPYIQAAIRDLQSHLNVATGLIQIISVEAVEWNDASLGCARPGSMSAQAITPGYLVVLQVEDQQYTYHTNSDNYVILCGEDGLPVPTDFSLPTDPNIDDGQPWIPAD